MESLSKVLHKTARWTTFSKTSSMIVLGSMTLVSLVITTPYFVGVNRARLSNCEEAQSYIDHTDKRNQGQQVQYPGSFYREGILSGISLRLCEQDD